MKILSDFRFWLFVFFIIGMENIDVPPMDDHAWRQTLTISMAKNLVDHPNVLYPRTILGGKTNGILGSEFPFLSYLLSLLYKIFGFGDWYGRLLNWTLSSLGLYALYSYIKTLYGQDHALYFALSFMSSITFVFARKTMPDIFAMSLILISLHAYFRYISDGSIFYLVAAALLFLLGGLSKFPFVCLILFLLLGAHQIMKQKKRFMLVVSTLMVSLILIAGWYMFWLPHLERIEGNKLVWPTTLSEGYNILMAGTEDAWFRLEVNAYSNRWPFFFSLMGLGLAFIRKEKTMLIFFFTYSLLFFLFVLKTGGVFQSHNYYVIPFIPCLSFFFGYFFSNLPFNKYLIVTTIFLFTLSGFINNKKLSFNDTSMKYYSSLSQKLDKFITKDDKIMINSGSFNPIGMYYAERKGWAVNNDVLVQTSWMPDFKKDGLKLIVVDKKMYVGDSLIYEVKYEDKDFIFYRP